MSNPAGDILKGHLLPSLMESFKTSLLLMTAYFKMRLSFPPDAYKNFSSALNFNPSQDFGISMLSRRIPFWGSMSCSDCVLCPLLVTAIYLPAALTAMFKGRSPSGKLLPAGVSDQPLGSKTLF